MTGMGWFQIFLYFAAVLALTKPMGVYMARVFQRETTFLDSLLRPVERLIYRRNLIALRELALRQVADQVDRSLESYMDAKDIRENWGVRERLAVCVSGNSSGQYLISRAARLARKMDAELYVEHVDRQFGKRWEDGKRLEGNLRFGENLGAQIIRLKGRSVADAIAEFVATSTSRR